MGKIRQYAPELGLVVLGTSLALATRSLFVAALTFVALLTAIFSRFLNWHDRRYGR